MKRLYLMIILIGVILSLLLVYHYFSGYKDIYIIYQNDNSFYKQKNDSTRYFIRKDKKVYELAIYEDSSNIKDLKKINSINVISLDSLIHIIPYSQYEIASWSNKKQEIFNNTRIFVIEIDSIKNKIKINEVYLPYTEYD